VNNWIFVTAAVGKGNIAQAAERLVDQVKGLNLFRDCIVFDLNTLLEIEPDFFQKFNVTENDHSRGFGFYAWKPILAKAALSNFWGEVDGVFYLDAGCEILPTKHTRSRIRNFMFKAESIGAVIFSTGKSELAYTKKSVHALFPNLMPDGKSQQNMSGIWFLSGDIGGLFAEKWHLHSSEIVNLNDQISDKESGEFIEHRHDQSIFSLVSKDFGIEPEPIALRGLETGIKKYVFAWIGPVRLARNLSGKSDVSFLHHFF